MYRGHYTVINNFKGGYAGNLPPTAISVNQAFDLDNIVIKPQGLGFRTRLGNSKLNSSALNSGANIQGLGYFLTTAGTHWLAAVAGNKFYVSSNESGTFTDQTGAIGITASADQQYTMITFNDLLILCSAVLRGNTDSVVKWTGSGNLAVLGGSPPTAYNMFTTNNRVFITRANESTIYWSVLGNAEDWSGAGSGSAVVGSLADSEIITACAVLSTNYVVIFKESSCYQMVTSSAPFPIYSLFSDSGCVGKNACVNIDGIVYWINQRKRMNSTDGETLTEYPPSADDLWNNVQQSRLPFINGFRQKGSDYDWLVWTVSTSGSTNNTSIIWDLLNKCWLKCSTGYKMNVVTTDNHGKVYMGDYAGFIFLPDQTATYADASESSPGTITGFWRSGWTTPSDADHIVQTNQISVGMVTKASGSITVNYGFDFNLDQKNFTLSQTATGSELYTVRSSRLTGRGNIFNYKISQSSSTIDTEVHQIILRGKTYGQKKIAAA